MNLLQALAAVERRGLMLRVRWDVAALAYRVELVKRDADTTAAHVHLVREEELLPWLVEQLQSQSD